MAKTKLNQQTEPETDSLSIMAGEATANFVETNDNQKLIVGESRDEFGNVYVFHSKTTGQPFYMTPKHFGNMTWNEGAAYQPTINCDFGKGSKQVTEEDIRNPDLDDSGLRRLTLEEGQQIDELPLEVKAMLGFEENKWFQLASVSRYLINGYFPYSDVEQDYEDKDSSGFLHCGRSPSRPKAE